MRILKSHPLFSLIDGYLVDSPQPSNISYLWNFGSLLGFCLVIQIVTGVTLAMHYNSNGLIFISNDEINQKISDLEHEYDELESDLEELRNAVQENEEFLQDEQSELSKTLENDFNIKEDIRGKIEQLRDIALYDENNVDKEKSLAVEQVTEGIDRDLRTLGSLLDEIPIEDVHVRDSIEKIDNKLQEFQEKVEDVAADLSDRLPGLSEPNSFPQDSSNFYPESSDLPSFEDSE